MDSMNKDKLIKGKDMYIATVQTNLIKTLHESLGLIVSDAEWIFDKDGMKTVAMDKTQTKGIYVRLSAEGFENGGIYYCTPDEVVRIGINIVNMAAWMKCIKDKNSVFHLYSKNGQTDKIHMVIDTAGVNSHRDIEMSTIDVNFNMDELNLYEEEMNREADIVVGIPATYFQSEIKFLDKIASYVKIEVLANKSLSITAHGEKMVGSTGKNTLTPGGDNAIKFYHVAEGKRFFEGYFNLSALASFVKCTSLCSTSHVLLHMSMDESLIIEYTIGDLGVTKFCLAQMDISTV